jgi:hypothetical protein
VSDIKFKHLSLKEKLTKFYVDGCLGRSGMRRQHELSRDAAQVIADVFGNEIVMRMSS